MEKKIEKIFLFLRHCISVSRHCISVREIFSDTIFFRDINRYGNRAVVQISTVVLPAHHAGCQSVL